MLQQSKKLINEVSYKVLTRESEDIEDVHDMYLEEEWKCPTIWSSTTPFGKLAVDGTIIIDEDDRAVHTRPLYKGQWIGYVLPFGVYLRVDKEENRIYHTSSDLVVMYSQALKCSIVQERRFDVSFGTRMVFYDTMEAECNCAIMDDGSIVMIRDSYTSDIDVPVSPRTPGTLRCFQGKWGTNFTD